MSWQRLPPQPDHCAVEMVIVLDGQRMSAGDGKVDRVNGISAAIVPLIDKAIAVEIEPDAVVGLSEKAIGSERKVDLAGPAC